MRRSLIAQLPKTISNRTNPYPYSFKTVQNMDASKTMKLQLKGIKSGQTIHLLGTNDIPDGEVIIEIKIKSKGDKKERLERLNRIFGAWKNQSDLDQIFTEIDEERHANYGRKIDSFDF
jgi:hypothetical protein